MVPKKEPSVSLPNWHLIISLGVFARNDATKAEQCRNAGQKVKFFARCLFSLSFFSFDLIYPHFFNFPQSLSPALRSKSAPVLQETRLDKNALSCDLMNKVIRT